MLFIFNVLKNVKHIYELFIKILEIFFLQMISQTKQPVQKSMEVRVNQERLREDTFLYRDRRGQGEDISRGTRVTERMDVRLEREVRGEESGGGRAFKQLRMDEVCG